MPSSALAASEALTRPQRLFTGLFLLLLVDVIWVASSEFTKYIFQNLSYDKPFFTSYFKTSLFMLYLSGFLFHWPWREQCRRGAGAGWPGREGVLRRRRRYERVNDSEEAVDEAEEADEEDDDDTAEDVPIASTSTGRSARSVLSSPTWIPVNLPDSGKSSGTESDNDMAAARSSNGNNDRGSRRVRFKDVAQVVEMNPADALYANLARLSYHANLRAQAALQRAASRLTLFEVLRLAGFFCLPWFAGNYCYQAALSHTEAAVVNVLSSSSCLFTLVLSALFPSQSSDRFTLTKLFAVAFTLVGVVLVCYSDLGVENGSAEGSILTLIGALAFSVYIVLVRVKVGHEDNMDAPMFFGFVGLFSTLLFWPGALILDYSGGETFVWPTLEQWQFLLLNGIVGTVISELLWLRGCFYTSSLMATLAISLTIPMSIAADVVYKQREYSPVFFVGAVPMFLSFFVVAMLTHYEDWDPLMDLVVLLYGKVKSALCPERRRNAYVFDRQERESLINQDPGAAVAASQDESI